MIGLVDVDVDVHGTDIWGKWIHLWQQKGKHHINLIRGMHPAYHRESSFDSGIEHVSNGWPMVSGSEQSFALLLYFLKSSSSSQWHQLHLHRVVMARSVGRCDTRFFSPLPFLSV